jgi:hypothetical protein
MALRAAEGLRALAPADPKTHRRLAQIYLGLIQPDLKPSPRSTTSSASNPATLKSTPSCPTPTLQGDPRRAVYFLTLFLDNVDPDRQSPAHTEPRARLDQLSRLAEQAPAAP